MPIRSFLALVLSVAMFGQCTPPSINVLITAHGDSITLGGQGSPPTTPYEIVTGASLATSSVIVTVHNYGTGGISWNYTEFPVVSNPLTMIQEAPTLVDPDLSLSGYKTKWLIAFAGTNGMNLALGNHDSPTEYANFEQYITARRAAGWDMTHTIVATMLPRGAGEESRRVAYNAALVAGASTYKYLLARFDLNMVMGQAGQNDDTMYYLDAVHPTQLGQSILAGMVYDVITGNTGNPQLFCGSSGINGTSLRKGTIR